MPQIAFFEGADSAFSVAALVNDKITIYTINGNLLQSGVINDLDLFMKEETIFVNGFEVSKPINDIESLYEDEPYFTATPVNDDFYVSYKWREDESDLRMIERGLAHLTKEAAVAHAKAMVGIDPQLKDTPEDTTDD